ncbi:MAG: AMP-binding protein, partial [Ktedonobacteraceae bacterium]
MSTTASNHPFHASTLLELLRERAMHQPDQQAYSFLPNGEVGEEERYTYAKLDQQARVIAAHLQELGL